MVRFQPEVCNDGHDLVKKTMNFNDVAIVTVKGNDYRTNFLYMSITYTITSLRNEAKTLLRNVDLTEKSRTLQNIKKNTILYKNG